MWTTLKSKKDEPQKLVVTDKVLEASYKRCRAYGLDVVISRPMRTLSNVEFFDIADRFRSRAPVLRSLFRTLNVVIPGREKIFALTDAGGNLVDVFGDRQVLAASHEMGIAPRVSFSEESVGTTAISLALSHQKPAYLAGPQHYCRMFHGWECLAVPIFDIEGELFGTIGIGSYLGSSIANDGFLDIVTNLIFRLDVSSSEGQKGLGDARAKNRNAADIVLSKRQLQVLRFRASGYLNKQIADELNIHIDTVKEHVSVALRRLRVKSVEEAIMVLARGKIMF